VQTIKYDTDAEYHLKHKKHTESESVPDEDAPLICIDVEESALLGKLLLELFHALDCQSE
jgi:hypothetical protein